MDMTPLSPEFREFLESLNQMQVEYMVVGGIAVNFHGYHRSTEDLDVWVRCSKENEERLAQALRQFGFSEKLTSKRPLLVEGRILVMGVEPLRIDICTRLPGIEFGECYSRRTTSHLAGVDVPFISVDDLKTNKKAAGRHKDLADVDGLP